MRALEQGMHRFLMARKQPYGIERSAKMSAAQFSAERALLTPNNRILAPTARVELKQFLTELNYPQQWGAELDRQLDRAEMLHFGYEQDAEIPLAKLYLEFDQQAADEPQPLIFQAYKWPVDGGVKRAVITEYRLRSDISSAVLIQRLSEQWAQAALVAVFEQLLITLIEAPNEPLFLLEVTEAGNPRTSYDLNLYQQQISIGSIKHQLWALAEPLALPLGSFAEWLAANDAETLGHISAGVSRHGEPFVTLYCGAKEYRSESQDEVQYAVG